MERLRPYFCLIGHSNRDRFIEACVVGPAVEGCKAERARGTAAASIVDTVCASTVPRHPNEEGSIMTVVGGPPLLRCRHHFFDVPLQFREVNGIERLSIVEVFAHRIG